MKKYLPKKTQEQENFNNFCNEILNLIHNLLEIIRNKENDYKEKALALIKKTVKNLKQ